MAHVQALDHIVLVARDVEQTLAWYGHHLGLAAERTDEWRRGEVLFPSLRIDEQTIIDVIAGDPGEGGGHLEHLCLVVGQDDLASLKADADLEIVDEGPRFGARGLADSVYVRDPDGLLVELRAYPA